MQYRIIVDRKIVKESDARIEMSDLKEYFLKYSFEGTNLSSERYEYLFFTKRIFDSNQHPKGYGWMV